MKHPSILLAAMVLLVVGSSAYLIRGQQLQTQVLNQVPPTAEEITEIDDCSKLSENAANNCYMRLAIENKDASICRDMSKGSLVERCEREVELAP
jgi:hypothetical protein